MKGTFMTENKKNWLMQCRKCRGKCCKYIALEIDKPVSKIDYDNIRWYLMHKNVTVFIDHENAWTLQFPAKCENLDTDYKCRIYSRRPAVCSEYPGENHCEFEGAAPPYKILFETESDLLKYMKKKGIHQKQKKK